MQPWCIGRMLRPAELPGRDLGPTLSPLLPLFTADGEGLGVARERAAPAAPELTLLLVRNVGPGVKGLKLSGNSSVCSGSNCGCPWVILPLSTVIFWRGENLPLQDGIKSDSWVHPLPSGWVWVWPPLDLLSSQACAVGLMAVGIGTLFVFNQTVDRGTASSVLPVVIIAVGAFLFLVAIVGCCGACQESYCLMVTVSGQWGQWAVWDFWKVTAGEGLRRWGGEESRCECSRDWLGPSHPHSKPDSCPWCLQFVIFLSLIVLVEVATAIAGYVLRDKVSKE